MEFISNESRMISGSYLVYSVADIRGSSETLMTLYPLISLFCMKKKDWSHLQLSSIGPREEHRQRTRSIVEAFHDMELALD